MRFLYLVTGYSALAFGVVGIFLPIVPTVPFLIVSAFCFSRSSERVHAWLMNHRWFGPPLQDWQREGAIPTRAKYLATAMLSTSILFSWFVLRMSGAIVLSVAAIFALVLAYIWTRPAPSRPT